MPHRSHISDPPPSILLITLSNIGDAVMTTPVMAAIHNKYPQSLLDIVADARSSSLFSHCPYVDDIILKDKRAGWRGTVALVKRLRRKHYDLVIDLRTDGLTLLLRARRRLTRQRRHSQGYHAVQRHFAAISQREHLPDIPTPHIWLSEAEHAFARKQLACLPGQRWLALGPGANWKPKCWPADNFSALIAHLEKQFDAVILLGSNADRQSCQTIADRQHMPCINLAGCTDLLQAAAVLERSHLFVGNDSGLGHLAAASDTPTVTVFGPGDPQRYHPWHPQARWVQSDTGRISDIDPETVVAQVTASIDE